ncbi:MAG: S1C family serine protease [Anaerolineae bacterium]|jgi:S1-C subfamily serine protease|nr:PDZ domain-containing protein [Chloroflexota bacterium]
MEKKSVVIITVIVGLIGLLLGCSGGAVLGGLAVSRLSPRTCDGRMDCPMTSPERTENWDQFESGPMGGSSIVVTSVVAGSPAERAGLRAGDLILQVDGEDFDAEDFSQMVADHSPEDVLTLTILRGGSTEEVEVTLGEHPDDAERAWLGISYQVMPTDMHRFGAPNK